MRPEQQNAFQRIYDEHGYITATLILDEAKPVKSPLHEFFEWDDTKAAVEFRYIQARTLIRRVKIEYQGREEPLVHVPSIRSENDSNEGWYKVPSVIVQSQGEFDRAYGQALSTFLAAERALTMLVDAAKGSKKKSVAKVLTRMTAARTELEQVRGSE